MENCYRKSLFKCSYETLVYEFVNFSEAKDQRTIDGFLGRPERTVHSTGSATLTRQNLTSEKLAQFRYFNTRRTPTKKGLLETLGYLHYERDQAILHHQRLIYYTKQATLETASSSQEMKGESAKSKEDLCVSSLGIPIHSCGERVGGKTALEVVPQIEAKEKKEESRRQHTRKCVALVENTVLQSGVRVVETLARFLDKTKVEATDCGV